MKLAKALTASIFWRGIYFLSVLILNILVARHFEAAGSGQIFYIINIFALAVMIASLCMEAPMGYYLSQNKMNEAQLAGWSLIWIVFIMIFVFFGIRSFSNLDVHLFEKNDFQFSANAFMAGNLFITFFIALFYAKLDFVLPNILLVIVNILLMVLVPNNSLVQQMLTSNQYINLYFGGFLAQGILITIAFIFKHVKWKNFSFIPNELIKPFFSFAFIAVVTNTMTFLMYRVDYWFVNKYCSYTDLGNYIQACKLAQFFFIIPAILASVVFPMTASGRKEEMNVKMQLLSRTLILLYGISCALLVAVGFWLFPFVFGNTFNKMYVPFILLVPAILSYSVTHLLTAYYGGKKVLSVNFWGSVIALTIIISGDLIFIPVYGIKGAAVVSSIGYISYMSYMMIAHIREYKSKIADFLIFKQNDWKTFYSIAIENIFPTKKDSL